MIKVTNVEYAKVTGVSIEEQWVRESDNMKVYILCVNVDWYSDFEKTALLRSVTYSFDCIPENELSLTKAYELVMSKFNTSEAI